MKKTLIFGAALSFLLTLAYCGSDSVPKAEEDQLAAVVLLTPGWLTRPEAEPDSAVVNDTGVDNCDEDHGTITDTNSEVNGVWRGSIIFSNCLVVDDEICHTQGLDLRMVINGSLSTEARADTTYDQRAEAKGTLDISMSSPKSYNFSCAIDVVARYNEHDWDIENYNISGTVCGYDWKTEIEPKFDDNYEELCELIMAHE